jgi:hypothetical protein
VILLRLETSGKGEQCVQRSRQITCIAAATNKFFRAALAAFAASADFPVLRGIAAFEFILKLR